jgi:hypothetical protein
MLMENARKRVGIRHSVTDLILVIARSAATWQSPGTQALNFRRLLRLARNDSHPDTLAKTFAVRFGQHILRGILILTLMPLTPLYKGAWGIGANLVCFRSFVPKESRGTREQ